jgi:hypothetical protein
MNRKTHRNLQQLIIQNRIAIEKDPREMEKIEKRLEQKHSKDPISTDSR